jgi:hypothetical protein
MTFTSLAALSLGAGSSQRLLVGIQALSVSELRGAAGEGELRTACKLLQVDIKWWAMVYDIQNSKL